MTATLGEDRHMFKKNPSRPQTNWLGGLGGLLPYQNDRSFVWITAGDQTGVPVSPIMYRCSIPPSDRRAHGRCDDLAVAIRTCLRGVHRMPDEARGLSTQQMGRLIEAVAVPESCGLLDCSSIALATSCGARAPVGDADELAQETRWQSGGRQCYLIHGCWRHPGYSRSHAACA